jgi:hypothetical protein
LLPHDLVCESIRIWLHTVIVRTPSRQCAAHGLQVAAKDVVIRSKASGLKARVLQHWLWRANQIGMLLGVADAAQLAPYPIGAPSMFLAMYLAI